MTDKLNLDDAVHELNFGKSFEKNSDTAFYSVRYDFTPSSLDVTKTSKISVGSGNSLSVKVPHVAGSSSTHTEYKGNKRTLQKECVLLIDHVTGEFTLEKLSCNMNLKSTRSQSNASKGKVVDNTKIMNGTSKTPSPKKPKIEAAAKPAEPPDKAPTPQQAAPAKGKNSSKPAKGVESKTSLSDESSSEEEASDNASSSSDTDSSDSDHQSEAETTGTSTKAKGELQSVKKPAYKSCLSEDLRLSESESD